MFSRAGLNMSQQMDLPGDRQTVPTVNINLQYACFKPL